MKFKGSQWVDLIIGVLALVVLFYSSALIWGPWWRHPSLPTPGEYSAIFGGVALIALILAWKQVKQVDESNRALIESNEFATAVSLETTRPRIQVYLEADRMVSKSRGTSAKGTIYVALINSGSSAAQNVRLSLDQPFNSLPAFFNAPSEANRDEHFKEVNEVFDGTVRFDYIRPGAKYIWFLGRAPELFNDEGNVPRRYEIHATYESQFRNLPYEDDFVIDLDIERRIEAPVDNLTRIGKDLEVIGDHLKAINKSIPDTVKLEICSREEHEPDSSSYPAFNSPEMLARLNAFGLPVPATEHPPSKEETEGG